MRKYLAYTYKVAVNENNTNGTSSRKRRDVSQTLNNFNFTIGSEMSCTDPKNTKIPCNAPLLNQEAGFR